MKIREVFGPPDPLEVHQIAALDAMQIAFMTLAEAVVANCPQTKWRESALEDLEKAYITTQVAARAPCSIITPDTLADLLPLVERRNTICVRIWMNVYDFAGIRKFGRDAFDIETRAEMIRQGIMGTIWASQIRVGTNIPQGYVVMVGEDELVEGAPDEPRDWEPPPERLVRV